MEDAEYRKRVQETFDRIERAFDRIDPDFAECEKAAGVLTIRKSGGATLVLNSQPSLRQLWLADGGSGRAYRFEYDTRSGKWLDNKDSQTELFSFLHTSIGCGPVVF